LKLLVDLLTTRKPRFFVTGSADPASAFSGVIS